jgi:hypothetical protein
MQDVNRVVDIEPLAEPLRLRTAQIHPYPLLLVLRAKVFHGILGRRGWWWNVVDRLAIRPPEPQLTVRVSIDLEPFLMHRAMVSPTQQHQVRERRGSTSRPVMDVVALTETYATAWEAAATVAVVGLDVAPEESCAFARRLRQPVRQNRVA